jgi:hypothetical protein
MELMSVLSYMGHVERRGYIRKIDGNRGILSKISIYSSIIMIPRNKFIQKKI